jgi:hypothetical protein
MQSLDKLLQIGLSSSGLSLTSENSKLLSESPSQLDGKKAFVPIDPLHTLMEAFPDKDPAQVVMAFQEYKGDVDLASSMLLKVGNLPTDRSFQQESTTNQMLDKEHSRTRMLLNRLKINFPTVDNTSLFEVLQSNNFSYRYALVPYFKHLFCDLGAFTSIESEDLAEQFLHRQDSFVDFM